eukprot:ANDGO_07723.mRNA.1 Trafficking protein particle complex II-specific subunit 120 homolog
MSLDVDASILDACRVRIALVPVGNLPSREFDRLRNIVSSLDAVSLSSAMKVERGVPATFPHLDWNDGRVRFKFVSFYANAANGASSDLGDFQAHRRISAVIGIIHCRHCESIATAHQQFLKLSRNAFPEAFCFRCFAFEPVDADEENVPLDKFAMIPSYGGGGNEEEEEDRIAHLRFYLTTFLADVVSDLIWSIEKHVTVAFASDSFQLLTPLDRAAQSALLPADPLPSSSSLSALQNASGPIGTGPNAPQVQVPPVPNMQIMQKKTRTARLHKMVGDFALLLGSTKDAYERYTTAVELCKSSNDSLWVAGAQEGLACTLLLLESHDFVDFSLLSRPSAMDRVSSLLSDIMSPAKSAPGSSSASSSSTITAGNGEAPAQTVEQRVRILYDEAISTYRKKKAFHLVVEGCFKMARFLSSLPSSATNVADAVSYISAGIHASAGLTTQNQVVANAAAAIVSSTLSCRRKLCFFLRQTARLHFDLCNYQVCLALLKKAADVIGTKSVSLYHVGGSQEAVAQPVQVRWSSNWRVLQKSILYEMILVSEKLRDFSLQAQLIFYSFSYFRDVFSLHEQQDLYNSLVAVAPNCPSHSPICLHAFSLLKEVKPLHVVAERKAVRTGTNVEAHSVFIYSNIGKHAANVNAPQFFTWVVDEPAEVELTFYNPYAFDLTVLGCSLQTTIGRLPCEMPRTRLKADGEQRRIRASFIPTATALLMNVVGLWIDIREFSFPQSLYIPVSILPSVCAGLTVVSPLPLVTVKLDSGLDRIILSDGETVAAKLVVRNHSSIPVTSIQLLSVPRDSSDIYHPDEISLSIDASALSDPAVSLLPGEMLPIPMSISGHIRYKDGATQRKCVVRISYSGTPSNSSSSDRRALEWEREAIVEFIVDLMPALSVCSITVGNCETFASDRRRLTLDVANLLSGSACLQQEITIPPGCSSSCSVDIPLFEDPDVWQKLHCKVDSKGKPRKLNHEDVLRCSNYLSPLVSIPWKSSLGCSGRLRLKPSHLSIELMQQLCRPMVSVCFKLADSPADLASPVISLKVGVLTKVTATVSVFIPSEEVQRALFSEQLLKNLGLNVRVEVSSPRELLHSSHSKHVIMHGKPHLSSPWSDIMSRKNLVYSFHILCVTKGSYRLSGHCHWSFGESSKRGVNTEFSWFCQSVEFSAV